MSAVSAGPRGPLTGLTVLRFAHAFDSGGGTERYLEDLDRALLERNAMTVIHLHLTRDPARTGPVERAVGQGMLVRVPLQIIAGSGSGAPTNDRTVRERLKQRVRDWVLYNPLVWHSVGARWVAASSLPRQPGQAIGAGAAAAEILGARHVDLVMMHFFGGSDADEVVREARNARVPFAVLNHYSNDRFLHLAIRKHAMLAHGVAGVNGLELPRYVRNGFANLSDGIDTDFFRREKARPLASAPSLPIILLPARVVPEKGQMDLVRAVASFGGSGVACCIAFAGRVDDSSFVQELKEEIARAKLTDRVHFLGDLTVEQLRDWYAASTVVAFPTYHHEGLGRVIVEAQAMETPVVAYATGGVPDGIESGRTGYLLRTGDVAGLAGRLRELLSSPELKAAMGNSGRVAAENRFSLAALADRHEKFYLRVIADARAAGAKPSAS